MQGLKWPLFYLHVDPVWSLLIVGTGFVLWVELPVQRSQRVFRRLTGCQWTPGIWGVTVRFWRVLMYRPKWPFLFMYESLDMRHRFSAG